MADLEKKSASKSGEAEEVASVTAAIGKLNIASAGGAPPSPSPGKTAPSSPFRGNAGSENPSGKTCEETKYDEAWKERTLLERRQQEEAIAEREADRRAREVEEKERRAALAEELVQKATEDRRQRELELERREQERKAEMWRADGDSPQTTVASALYTSDMSVLDANKSISPGGVKDRLAAFRKLEAPVLQEKQRDEVIKQHIAAEREAKRAKAEQDERQRLQAIEAERIRIKVDEENRAELENTRKRREAGLEKRREQARDAPQIVAGLLRGEGIPVTKHSRNGKSVVRVLASKDACAHTLAWYKPKHKQTLAGISSGGGGSLSASLGAPDKTFDMSTVRSVRAGTDTDTSEFVAEGGEELRGTALLRAVAPGDLCRSFSLILDERTLDFTCSSAKECFTLVHGFHALLFPDTKRQVS